MTTQHTNHHNQHMQGKVVLITGATAGIGKVSALELAKIGATVVIVGRNPGKVAATVREVQAQSGNASVEGLLADLAAPGQIRAMAQTFKEKHNRLDMLLNNAGAVFSSRKETHDGFEMTFALNHLHYFLLTHLLLDVLQASAPSRIINVASDAHRAGRMNFDDLQGKRRYNGWAAYSQSKLANVLFTYELARRLEGSGVTANALHPGAVATNFGDGNGILGDIVMTIFRRFAISPEQGARTSIYLASAPEIEGVTGKYYTDCKPVNSSPASYDKEAARRLWQISEELTGVAIPVS